MDEDLMLENALFPWLETDCMSDETVGFMDDPAPLETYCTHCLEPIDEYDCECPSCGTEL